MAIPELAINPLAERIVDLFLPQHSQSLEATQCTFMKFCEVHFLFMCFYYHWIRFLSRGGIFSEKTVYCDYTKLLIHQTWKLLGHTTTFSGAYSWVIFGTEVVPFKIMSHFRSGRCRLTWSDPTSRMRFTQEVPPGNPTRWVHRGALDKLWSQCHLHKNMIIDTFLFNYGYLQNDSPEKCLKNGSKNSYYINPSLRGKTAAQTLSEAIDNRWAQCIYMRPLSINRKKNQKTAIFQKIRYKRKIWPWPYMLF